MKQEMLTNEQVCSFCTALEQGKRVLLKECIFFGGGEALCKNLLF